MSRKNIVKLIVLNLTIILINVLIFSKGFIGLTFSSPLSTAFGLTLIIVSAIVFAKGNYNLLFKAPEVKLFNGSESSEPKDFISALEERTDKKVFESSIRTTIEQINRLEQKDDTLNTILKQYFAEGEMTYNKFEGVITETKQLFLSNIKKMINRITIFDYTEYVKLRQQYKGDIASNRSNDPKAELYCEHIEYVNAKVKANEEILTKLDTLLVEISKLDDVDDESFEKLEAIQQINNLIANTKYYK